MPDDTTRRGYHHGDARQALMDAAGALLEQGGASALSLRQVAERAGLSHQAPYNHFRNKEALLAEIAQGGFGRLKEALHTAALGSVDGERELAALAGAYIAFAQASPALFRLMFARERVDPERHDGLAAASVGALSVLSAAIARIMPIDQREACSLAAWCLVHGYATLSIEAGIEEPAMREQRAAQFADIIVASRHRK